MNCGFKLTTIIHDAQVLLRLLRHLLNARLAQRPENTLHGPKTQGQRQILLSKVDGGTSMVLYLWLPYMLLIILFFQAQHLIDATTAAFKAGKIASNPFAQAPPKAGVAIPPPNAPPPRPGQMIPGMPPPPMMLGPHIPMMGMRPPPMMGMPPPMAGMPGMRMMMNAPPPMQK